MRENIHPDLKHVEVSCACGHSFKTLSTIGEDFKIEICSACHPFYTGKQKLIDTAGKIDKFNQRYAKFKKEA